MDQAETAGQTKKTGSWKNSLIVVLFILLLTSVGANYFFVTNNVENQQEIERIEAELRVWESSFRSFYYYANREWSEAEKYSTNILIKEFSKKMAEENDWSVKEQLQWEILTGENYVKRLLEIERK